MENRRRPIFSAFVTILLVGLSFGASWILSRESAGLLRDFSQFLFSQLKSGFVPLTISMALFSLVERRTPAGPQKSLGDAVLGFQIIVVYYFAGSLAGFFGSSLAMALHRHFALGWVDLRLTSVKSAVTLIASVLISTFVFDFVAYWYHRLQHTLPILCQVHKFHHMDEKMNVLTSARQNWIEDFIRIPLLTIPLTILFKVNAREAGMTGVVVGFLLISWGVFQHSNVKVHLGWASVLVNGPQIHRIHHSRLPEHFDRNFAGNFPILDLLFGTYYHPAPDEFPPTGVNEEMEVRTLAEASTVPFRGWWRMLRNWQTLNSSGSVTDDNIGILKRSSPR